MATPPVSRKSAGSQLTREDLASAAGDGDQVLHQVLGVSGLSTATLAQQHDGLVLTRGQKVPVGCLGHGIDVGGCVFPPTALEHVHHLCVCVWWWGGVTLSTCPFTMRITSPSLMVPGSHHGFDYKPL